MKPTYDRDAVVDLVKAEMKTATDIINGLMKTSDQMIVLAVTVIFGFLTVGSKVGAGSQRASIIAAPFAIALLIAYALRVATAVNALGGYRAALEEWVTNALDLKQDFLWEHSVAADLKLRPGFIVSQGLQVAAFATSVAVAGYVGTAYYWHEHTPLVIVTLCASAGVLSALITAYVSSLRSFALTYECTRRRMPPLS